MNYVPEKIKTFRYLPITKIDDIDDVKKIINALLKADFPILEITFRTRHAAKAINIVSEDFPEVLIGAGTVLNITLAKDAIDAGAKFVVSPGLDAETVKFCLDNNITVIPGINTPTGLQQAVNLGLEVCKYFPAEASGGLNYLNAMSAPFDDKIKFIATGGVNKDNISSYLQNKRILACGGSWIINDEILQTKNFDKMVDNINELKKIADL